MKVLFITPGSGDGYYCANCFRDNLQAQALKRAGHDVSIAPLYLPLRHISPTRDDVPLFFPATAYYLERKTGRALPAWLDRTLRSDAALGMAASLSGTTHAQGLEDLTLSMIEGNDETFARHMRELTEWIRKDRPAIIQLASSLLLGIAREIKATAGILIVCSLQDEEVWIDQLAPDAAEQAWRNIAQGASAVDRFITTSHHYAETVRLRLPQLPAPRVIYPGVAIDRYQTTAWPEDPTIGFFYRMNRPDGLDLLAEAFVLLKRRGTVPRLKLRIGGGSMRADHGFLRQIRRTLKPYAADVTIEKTYTWAGHADFYRQITVLSVPLRFTEGVGLYLCEAFAAGRPAVEPQTGSFPEILSDAGLTYTPNDAPALADALERILTDRTLFERCSTRARALSRERYSDTLLAEQLIAVYRELVP
ncbi:MAG: glycosyltransferase family 4 protein [Kiritimatiellae bacterium]|nr:glycosyltransferase family 4 protein [Kiritimatiellia bacterium]